MMHVSPEEVAAFRAGTLDRQRIEAIGAHVRECRDCARLVLGDSGVQESAEAVWKEDEVSSRAKSRDPLRMHETRSAGRGFLDSARNDTRWWYAAAAAVLIAILSFWITRDDPAPPPPSRPVAPRVATAPRVIRDGAVAITVDEDGDVQSVTTPREEWTVLLTAALRHGRLPQHDARALTAPAVVLRGEEQRAAVQLLQPVGVVVESDRPFFRWSGVDDALYRVIVAQDGKPVAKSEMQTGRMWIPHTPLGRGVIYEWQVTALIGETESTFPAADQPPARFRILSAAEFEELEAAKKTGSKLLASLVAARLGLIEVKARELERMLTASSPHPR
jgi:hypothetical protein